MSERDNRVKAFEKLMRGGLSSTDVFCLKNQLMAIPRGSKFQVSAALMLRKKFLLNL